MHKSILIPLLIAILAIVLFVIVSSTMTIVLLFIPGVIIAFIVYLNTFYKKTPNPKRIFPLYLLALGVQFIHFAEEYLTDFVTEIPKLLGQEAYPKEYWVAFNMVAYFVFIIGGIILFKQIKNLMIIPLFFIIVGILLNSAAHIMISIYVGGYFSGLYSALIFIFIGPLLMKRILDETKIIEPY